MFKLFIIALVLFPGISFAQLSSQVPSKATLPKPPKPPASFVAFLQEENAARAVFNKQEFEARDTFLKTHPDVKSYLEHRNPPQPPASWTAFVQQDNPKRTTFENQLTQKRNAFLNENPDAQTYLIQIKTFNQARTQALRTAHPQASSSPAPT